MNYWTKNLKVENEVSRFRKFSEGWFTFVKYWSNKDISFAAFVELFKVYDDRKKGNFHAGCMTTYQRIDGSVIESHHSFPSSITRSRSIKGTQWKFKYSFGTPCTDAMDKSGWSNDGQNYHIKYDDKSIRVWNEHTKKFEWQNAELEENKNLLHVVKEYWKKVYLTDEDINDYWNYHVENFKRLKKDGDYFSYSNRKVDQWFYEVNEIKQAVASVKSPDAERYYWCDDAIKTDDDAKEVFTRYLKSEGLWVMVNATFHQIKTFEWVDLVGGTVAKKWVDKHGWRWDVDRVSKDMTNHVKNQINIYPRWSN